MRIAGLLLILAFSLAVCLAVAWRPSDSTRYALDYTEAGFRSIRVGMSRQRVIRTLGEPLSIDSAPGYILWVYAPNGGKPEPSGDGGWIFPPRSSTFHADPAGTIVSIDGDYLDLKKDDFLKHPLRDVKDRFGDPTEVYSAPDRDLYFYSLIDGKKGHYVRIIDISKQGFVCSIGAGRIGYYVSEEEKRNWGWLEWLEDRIE